jgi:hypothetical protein
MKDWLRRVTPDLFLAAVVALVIMVAVHKLDAVEDQRISADARTLASDGLTIDERIDVLDDSIRRSTMLYLPALAGFGGVAVGLASRRRRWAWLTAIGAIIPALLMGAGFFIDTPLPGSVAIATYIVIAVSLATAGVAVRNRLLPERVQQSNSSTFPRDS